MNRLVVLQVENPLIAKTFISNHFVKKLPNSIKPPDLIVARMDFERFGISLEAQGYHQTDFKMTVEELIQNQVVTLDVLTFTSDGLMASHLEYVGSIIPIPSLT